MRDTQPSEPRQAPRALPFERSGERTLVRRMLAGDERAFERFSEEYLPPLYRYASRRLRGDRELTREIVQATVCKAIAKLATFRGEAGLATWLCACCGNEIAAHFRGLARAGRPVDIDKLEAGQVEPPGERPAGPQGSLLRRETRAQVHDALDSLPPHYGRALEWKYLEELPVREIARRLELSAKAAESLLTRAREAFRAAYDGLAAPTSDRGRGAETPLGRRRLEYEA